MQNLTPGHDILNIFVNGQHINLNHTQVQLVSNSINEIIHTKANHNLHLSIQNNFLNKIIAILSRKSNLKVCL